MPAVVFSAANFVARYPEFAAYNTANPNGLQQFFNEACIYLSNGDAPVASVTRRTVLLNMLTAHIAFLAGVLSADGMPRPVGRVSQASEGSVSASFEAAPPTPGSGEWFKQTQYGAAFWQATSGLRGFAYISCPTTF